MYMFYIFLRNVSKRAFTLHVFFHYKGLAFKSNVFFPLESSKVKSKFGGKIGKYYFCRTFTSI